MIPQDYIDELRARIDIVALIDSRVKLKKMGKNYMACCPFHDEKSPSFSVNEQGQFFYCFGCGATGNGIGFLMRYERIEFGEAVRKLAMMNGMSEPDRATRQEITGAELRKLEEELRDERLIVEIGNVMEGRGEFITREDRERHRLAQRNIVLIRDKIYKLKTGA